MGERRKEMSNDKAKRRPLEERTLTRKRKKQSEPQEESNRTRDTSRATGANILADVAERLKGSLPEVGVLPLPDTAHQLSGKSREQRAGK